MNIVVNGTNRAVESPPLTPLLHVLREELDVLSPKAGCENGGCGACTVLLDGAPRRSCLTAVGSIGGAAVTTVEGLGTPEDMSAVQRAFVHYCAAQCGFCTPGMILAATAYLERGGSTEVAEISEALAGHVCRCTGYLKIVDAVAAARDGDFDLSTTAESPHTTVLG
ncbi:MAG: (2Fe-2S)-binding protein [bacterium]|nr:(2Fe-2S)-binding protein [bacterium]